MQPQKINQYLNQKLSSANDKTQIRLETIFFKMKDNSIELERLISILNTLNEKGNILTETDNDTIIIKIIDSQQKDGGWNSTIETAHCIRFLNSNTTNNTQNITTIKNSIKQGIDWIKKSQNDDGGFGRSERDMSRIPTTTLVLSTIEKEQLGNTVINDAIIWLIKTWSKDMELGGLTYKCSRILSLSKTYDMPKQFIKDSIQWLLKQQNDDGGWGAQRQEFFDSVPSYTARAIDSLIYAKESIINDDNDNKLKIQLDTATQSGIRWLIDNQQSSGLWKEHPLEEALCTASKLFRNINNKTKKQDDIYGS